MSDLAQRIRAARDKMGVSIEEAERATKIRRRYIEAIEAGDFDRLPDGPPSRGFIKNYARYLGMDPDQSLTDFEAEVGVPILQLNEFIPPPPTRQQAVSRYTQLVKLPQVRWKGELPASDQAELDMLADGENGNESHALPQNQEGSNGRMVLRRTEVPPSPPNSFSLREPKVAQTSDVRPFQMGRSPFSLRNLTGPLSSQAAAQPYRISPMSMNGPDHTRSLMVFGAAVGGLVAVVALVWLVLLPIVRGASQAINPEPTQAISIAFIGASPQPTDTLSVGISSTVASLTTPGTPDVASTPAPGANSSGTPAAPDAQATQEPAAIAPLPGGGVQLVLDAHEHAWVRVRADGNVVYEGIPPIGPNSTWNAQNTVSIETGNAGAFDVILNNVRLGPPGAHDATLKVTWDATGKVIPN
jgi:transcriptional regulator with XRE-family HTH domain